MQLEASLGRVKVVSHGTEEAGSVVAVNERHTVCHDDLLVWLRKEARV